VPGAAVFIHSVAIDSTVCGSAPTATSLQIRENAAGGIVIATSDAVAPVFDQSGHTGYVFTFTSGAHLTDVGTDYYAILGCNTGGGVWYGSSSGTGTVTGTNALAANNFTTHSQPEKAYSICDDASCSLQAAGFDRTRIDSISPADASSTASTTVTVSIGYYSNSDDGLDNIGYSLWDTSKGYTVVFDGVAASTTYGTLGTYTTHLTLISGDTYKLTAFLTNDAGDAYRSADSGTTGADATGASQFSVNTAFTGNSAGICPTTPTGDLATTSCDILNLTGCVQNALVWAFCPTPANVQMVAQDGNQIKTRPPVGYIFTTIEALQSIGATGTPALALTEDWPIMHYIFQPLTLLLTTAIWILFGVGLLYRVRRIEL